MNYTTTLTSVHAGFDGKTCWVNPWAGICPDGRTGILTVQRLDLSGSDVFFGACDARTEDIGQSWTAFEPVPAMQRTPVADGLESCVNDLKPKWHAASGTMLGIGVRSYYRQNARHPDHVSSGGRSPETVWSVWNFSRKTWSDACDLGFCDIARPAVTVAGSVQRQDEANGDILLPLSCSGRGEKVRTTIVSRCVFRDGQLLVAEMGNGMRVPIDRGLLEPSLTQVDGRYLLTMRNDQAAYVSSSSDGLHFDEPRVWRFDDGEMLGSYNTQQHWVRHSNGLFLVYTRRGLSNDHVFRHRAPLMIAQVDPDALVVLRSTERELVPNRGARLGNFSVCDVSQHETWVLVAEWMQPEGCEQYGSDNTIWIARIKWSEPNRLVSQS
jgi:hypothetical protein